MPYFQIMFTFCMSRAQQWHDNHQQNVDIQQKHVISLDHEYLEGNPQHTLFSAISTNIFLTICCVLCVISKCTDNEQMPQQLQHIFHSAWHRGGSRNRGGGGSCARQGTHISWASRIQGYHRGTLPAHLMARTLVLLHLTIYNPETTRLKHNVLHWRNCSRHFVSFMT